MSLNNRSITIRTAIKSNVKKNDIVSPGHIFPIISKDGGVLVRAGHTEASIDISKLAKKNPSAVICEIMNDDGTMARLPELINFAKEHSHNKDNSIVSAWSVGVLMGIGGVRGMLVTLTLLQGNNIDWTMILAFVLGVCLVFLSFGISILYLNKRYLTNITNVRRVLTTAGILSVIVGTNMLLA